MTLFERTLKRLGYEYHRLLQFRVRQSTYRTLCEIAWREQCSVEEVARRLLVDSTEEWRVAQERLTLWNKLSPREMQSVALTCLGYTNKEIALKLGISDQTVKIYIRGSLGKLGLSRRYELHEFLKGWDFSSWGENKNP